MARLASDSKDAQRVITLIEKCLSDSCVKIYYFHCCVILLQATKI